MNPDFDALIDGYLDGTLSEPQESELSGWLKSSPVNARHFADAVRFHNRLHDVFRAEAEMSPVASPLPPAPARRWSQATILSCIASLAAMLFLGVWILLTPTSAAAELNRLMQTSATNGDRSYRITSLDPNPRPIEPRQAPVDGAILHVRPTNQYVLVRKFPDGREYITGCDGEVNWDVPPNGAVRLSHDPLRFRWALPGNQHGIPFLDLRSDLAQLRDAYNLTKLPTDTQGRRGLQAVKKSIEYRGPNRVEIRYDADTGTIHRMVFEGLPQARGGPTSVVVDLLEQKDLGPNFYRHESHHTSTRKVVEED